MGDEAYRAEFERYDHGNKGYLDHEDVADLYRGLGFDQDPEYEKELVDGFAQFDKNGNASIEFDEFSELWNHLNAGDEGEGGELAPPADGEQVGNGEPVGVEEEHERQEEHGERQEEHGEGHPEDGDGHPEDGDAPPGDEHHDEWPDEAYMMVVCPDGVEAGSFTWVLTPDGQSCSHLPLELRACGLPAERRLRLQVVPASATHGRGRAGDMCI